MAEAKKNYLKFIKKGIALDRKLGGEPFWDVDSSIIFKYHLEAGIDAANLEALPGDSNIMYGALRGASRGYGKKKFGAHIAMSWYGGAKWDPLWFKRWKLSLYFSYLSGANFIYSEGGHFGHSGLGNKYEFNSLECKKFRKILRDFYIFCQNNPRPKNGPLVKVAFLHGNLDGSPGLWSNWVWGQFRDKSWQDGDAERGWDYLQYLYQKEEWFSNTLTGKVDLSGNPPYGQYDILPIEAPQKILNNYSCAILLGWNTMTDEIYKKLKNYVKQGGHLIMTLPQLSIHLKRKEDLKLYKKGDYSDLFGVKIRGKAKELVTGVKFIEKSSLMNYHFPNWTLQCDPKYINRGFRVANIQLSGAKVLAISSTHFYADKEEKNPSPILLEKSLGKGNAFLITSWCYPGAKDMNPFMKEVIKTVMIGEQDNNLRIISSDKVRYALYEEKGKKTLYLLNTDFDIESECQLLFKNKANSFLLRPTELKIVNLSRLVS